MVVSLGSLAFRGRRTVAAALVLAAAFVTVPQLAEPARAAGPRPDFRMPFSCNETWRLTTYHGHNPDDKKMDMFRLNGSTDGSAVRPAAPGTVNQLFHPGGVEINHGGGWFTTYMHMRNISVGVGQRVDRNSVIGRVGSVGTGVAHLHHEHLLDQNGNNDGETWEMVYPVIQGREYRLNPDGAAPAVTSTNACGESGRNQFPTWGTDVRIRQDATTKSSVVGTLPSGATVEVKCQKRGEKVTVDGHTNDAWSLLPAYGGYISNIFIDTPDAWLPGVPTC